MADIFSGETQFRNRAGAQRYNPLQDAQPAATATPAPAAPTAPAANPPAPVGAPAANQAAPVDNNAAAPGGYDLGPLHFGFTKGGTPGVSWSGSSWVPSSQDVHDFANRLSNNVLYGAADPITAKVKDLFNPNVPVAQAFNPAIPGADLPTLRTQREQANQQMSPWTRGAADIASQFSPGNLLLNRVGGPVLQGAAQQGAESFNKGDDWSTVRQNAGTGAATGVAARLAGGALNPENIGSAAGTAVKAMPGLLGLHFGGDFGPAWMADKLSKGIVEPAAQKVENWLGSVPYPDWARTAVQNAVLGGTQTAADTPEGRTAVQNVKNAATGMDWNTAKTALQNLRGMLPY